MDNDIIEMSLVKFVVFACVKTLHQQFETD